MRKAFEALFTEKELTKNEQMAYKYQQTRFAWMVYSAGYAAGKKAAAQSINGGE
jgi:hypothetical protein